MADVDALFDELRAAEALHSASAAGPVETEWGTREFHALDGDGNLLTFFRSQA